MVIGRPSLFDKSFYLRYNEFSGFCAALTEDTMEAAGATGTAKALLVVWTIMGGGYGVSVKQTATPIPSVETCNQASEKINGTKIPTHGMNVTVVIKAICTPF
ncbi:hypothetical protein K8R03_01800 [Candidatus Kaiserbacteria bacterium]|nr:hypothetical protein [Candidatus Kaiserbacteria bacterium]